jgi:hypothetical protein
LVDKEKDLVASQSTRSAQVPHYGLKLAIQLI